MEFNPSEHPHRRWNPLTEEWILVSPHRAKRPWTGQIEQSSANRETRPKYDPECYLCPGNTRASEDKRNPNYQKTYVFDNDFPALLPHELEKQSEEQGPSLIQESAERGICRVLCFSPRHDRTLAEMPQDEISSVIELWRDQYLDLGSKPFINAVTIFENKGKIMGCSNPHPHGQIWSTESIPTLLSKEIHTQEHYFNQNGRLMLLDYLEWELEVQKRILFENDDFVVLVPHWAVWPFETLLLPRRPVQSIDQLSDPEQKAWADLLSRILIRYDNLFNVSFPYSMGIHQKPTDGKAYPGFQMHQHLFPPLLRSATIKKFQVGYEMTGEPQRDITAEQAAERLRSLPSVHYKLKESDERR